MTQHAMPGFTVTENRPPNRRVPGGCERHGHRICLLGLGHKIPSAEEEAGEYRACHPNVSRVIALNQSTA